MKLTKEEQRELKRLDRRILAGKATYAQILRGIDLKRKRQEGAVRLGELRQS